MLIYKPQNQKLNPDNELFQENKLGLKKSQAINHNHQFEVKGFMNEKSAKLKKLKTGHWLLPDVS